MRYGLLLLLLAGCGFGCCPVRTRHTPPRLSRTPVVLRFWHLWEIDADRVPGLAQRVRRWVGSAQGHSVRLEGDVLTVVADLKTQDRIARLVRNAEACWPAQSRNPISTFQGRP